MSKFWKSLLNFLRRAFATPVLPSPTPTPTPIPPDDISPATIIWDESAGNVGEWLCSVTMVGAKMTRDGMRVDRFVGIEKWALDPSPENDKYTIGNWFVIAKADDGAWHGAAADWLGRGKTSCVGKHWVAGTDGLHGALARWTAQRGEVVYMMVSTPARAGVKTTRERSQIVKSVIP